MTVLARRIAAVPKRTSTDTWRAIAALLAAPGSPAHAELTAVTNVAGMLIAEECTRDNPIVVTAAAGPRVRIYTVHGEDALDDDEVNESPLAAYPTDEDQWQVALPCQADELASIAAALAAHPRVAAHADDDDASAVTAAASATSSGGNLIDLAELERP
ncbi:MAG TPA: hypothetical protein VNA20_10530 [Frankiaceae bacterium]|nr:hypothetical protein [Frankiaceae bacterium]